MITPPKNNKLKHNARLDKLEIETAVDEKYTVSIDTKMMDHIETGCGFDLLTEITPRLDHNNNLEVFALDSKKNLVHITEEPTSQTGWEMKIICDNVSQISLTPPNENQYQRLFVLKQSYISESSSTWFLKEIITEESTEKTIFTKQSLKPTKIQIESFLMENNGVWFTWLENSDIASTFIFCLSGSGKSKMFPIKWKDESNCTKFSSITLWEIPDITHHNNANFSLNLIAGNSNNKDTNPCLTFLNCSWNNNSKMIDTTSKDIFAGPTQDSACSVQDFSITADRFGNPRIYSLICLDNGKSIIGEAIYIFQLNNQEPTTMWDTNSIAEFDQNIQLWNKKTSPRLTANLNASSNIEIYLQSQGKNKISNRIYHCESIQTKETNPAKNFPYKTTYSSQWSEFIPIVNSVESFGIVNLSKNISPDEVNHYSNLICSQIIGSQKIIGKLLRFSQVDQVQSANDAKAISLDSTWNEEEIVNSNEQSTSLVTQHSYRVCMTFLNSAGEIAPNVACKLSTSDMFIAKVNGESVNLLAGVEYKATSNALGQVNVSFVLVNELSCPTLTVSSSVINNDFTVRADASTQNFFANVTIDQLKQPLTLSNGTKGTAIIKPKYQDSKTINEIQSAIKNAAKISDQLYSKQSTSASFFIPDMDMSGIRVLKKGNNKLHNRLDPNLLPKQAWKYSNINGQPSYSLLTADEFSDIWSNAKHPSELSSFFDDIGAGLGDIIESVKQFSNDVAKGVTEIVEVAISAAQAAITVVINGIKHTLKAAIEIGKDALDVVSVVLESVGASIVRVMLWVSELAGFTFPWTNILKVKDTIKDRTLQVPTAIAAKYGKISRAEFDQSLTNFFGNINTNFKNDIKKTSKKVQKNDNIVSSIFTSHNHSFINSGTWLMEMVLNEVINFKKIINPLPDFSKVLTALDSIAPKDDSPFSKLITQLESNIKSLIENPLDAITESLNEILNMFSSIPDILEKALTSCLEGAYNLFISLLEMLEEIKDWLKSPIHNPLLNSFYKEITRTPTKAGDKLTILDLISLMIATPVQIAKSLSIQNPLGKELDDGLDRDSLQLGAVIGTLFTGMFHSSAETSQGRFEATNRTLALVFSLATTCLLVPIPFEEKDNFLYSGSVLMPIILLPFPFLKFNLQDNHIKLATLKRKEKTVKIGGGSTLLTCGVINFGYTVTQAPKSSTIILGTSTLKSLWFIIDAMVDRKKASNATKKAFLKYVRRNFLLIASLQSFNSQTPSDSIDRR